MLRVLGISFSSHAATDLIYHGHFRLFGANKENFLARHVEANVHLLGRAVDPKTLNTRRPQKLRKGRRFPGASRAFHPKLWRRWLRCLGFSVFNVCASQGSVGRHGLQA